MGYKSVILTVSGGDLASTWVTKPKVHVEEVAYPRKNYCYKNVNAKNRKKVADATNDAFFDDSVVASPVMAKAA